MNNLTDCQIEQIKCVAFEIFSAGFVSCTNGEDLREGFLKYLDSIMEENKND